MKLLSDFSCDLNPEVEFFLKNRSLKFQKKKIAITYLVLDDALDNILGYYTLSQKDINLQVKDLSKNPELLKELKYYFNRKDDDGDFQVPAFLIGQFGKNFSNGSNKRISGNDLMKYTFVSLCEAQSLVGGILAFVECENKEKLLDFYQNDENGFVISGKRTNESDMTDYIQLIALI